MTPSLVTTYAHWGTPVHPVELSDVALAFLTETLGEPQPTPARPPADVAIPDPQLDTAALAELADIVGAGGVSTSGADRLGHATGCSLTDYLKLRAAHPDSIPDAVLRPSDHQQVRDLLAHCSERGIVVIPFGGGTSVVAGVSRPDEAGAAVAVSLDRMADIIDIDDVSLTATVQPGIVGPTLERILGTKGLTWGHIPQSWERANVGGYIATRSAGQASTGYGRSDETVESLRVATPTGELTLGKGPKSAAGPDLRQLFIGSEGALGIITEVTLRIRRQPAVRKYEGLMFPGYAEGVAAFRELAQAHLTADVMRLSDPPETTANLAMSGPQGRLGDVFERYLEARKVSGGCMAILGWEGHSKAMLKARRHAAWQIMRKHGAATLGGSVGSSWKRHRFDGPYLRDALLDRGFIVETLETAAHWRSLDVVRQAVEDGIRGELHTDHSEAYVMSHVSHVYETGASLYFTVIAPAEPDPVGQWARAKKAAMAAIVTTGATITHHHAVGRDHLPWLQDEIGAEGVRLLRGIKDLVDPAGIMNPGVLVPERR